MVMSVMCSVHWRRREFNVGRGDEALKGVRCGKDCWFPTPLPHQGKGLVWGGGSAPSPEFFLFCDLEMAYFGEF